VGGEITTDASIMAALGRQMSRAVQRQSVSAGNLANLDTPGYRTKEVQFADALDSQLLAIGRAAGDFSAAQTVLAAKFRLVRYAINEGR
jgi:flagellar basal-body rod protein FlgB